MNDQKANNPKPAKSRGRSGYGGETSDEISRQLQSYYDSIVEEGTPDVLLDLLEKLEAVEGKSPLSKDK